MSISPLNNSKFSDFASHLVKFMASCRHISLNSTCLILPDLTRCLIFGDHYNLLNVSYLTHHYEDIRQYYYVPVPHMLII